MNTLEKQATILGLLCGVVWLILVWKTITLLLPFNGVNYWIIHIVIIILISLFCTHCLKGVGE